MLNRGSSSCIFSVADEHPQDFILSFSESIEEVFSRTGMKTWGHFFEKNGNALDFFPFRGILIDTIFCGAVAQLARAIRSHRIGRGFNSHLLHHFELVEGRKSNIPALVYFAITASKSAVCDTPNSPTENEIHSLNRVCLDRSGLKSRFFGHNMTFFFDFFEVNTQ